MKILFERFALNCRPANCGFSIIIFRIVDCVDCSRICKAIYPIHAALIKSVAIIRRQSIMENKGFE